MKKKYKMSETPKARLKLETTNGLNIHPESYNISSVSHTGVGEYTIYFKEPISKPNIITRIKNTIMKIIKRKRK